MWSSLAMSLTLSFTPLAHWLTLIVAGLRKAAAARAGRDQAVAPLVALLWARLARLTARFDALVARLAAGRPAAPHRQRTRPARAAPAGTGRLPRSHARLIRLLPGEAASYGCQLQAMLADPQTAALLAAAPEAGRILRPLCRLLMITPEGPLALSSAAGKPAPRLRAAKPAPVIPLTWAELIARSPAVEPDPPPRWPIWLRLP
jgi:hypothetical protein